jgi:MYXO-CTERM domain-containing protein
MHARYLIGSLLVTLTAVEVAHAVGSCGSGGPLGETVSVDYEGSLYYVSTPASYDEATAWPLIFGLHGDEGDPASSVNWFWRDVVDDRFIFVAPKAPNAGGSWYEETESNSAWMDGLLASVLEQYNVDLDRIYIWGLSGGAMFSSDYALARQDVFAAVEYNMGGSARGYAPAPSEACRIPARFVVSETDFLRENALGLFDELTMAGHETVWVDADCQDHCFDEEQAGPVARDWLLGFTLCGATPSSGCREGSGDSEPLDTTSTATTTSGSTSDGSTPDAATTGGATTGSIGVTGTTGAGEVSTVTTTGMVASGTTGADPAGTSTATTGGPSPGATSIGVGGAGMLASATTTSAPGYTFGGEPEQNGCTCRAAGVKPGGPAGLFGAFVVMLAAGSLRRRRMRA